MLPSSDSDYYDGTSTMGSKGLLRLNMIIRGIMWDIGMLPMVEMPSFSFRRIR